MRKSSDWLGISRQITAWSIVLLVTCIMYFVIRRGQSALGLDFIFHNKLSIGDERASWVLALVFCPFVVGITLFLFSTVMSKSTKLIALFGTAISYVALTGQIILSMSGIWLLISPLILPLQPIEKWLGLNKAGFLPIRGTAIQDIIVPALIALGIAITAVGLLQVVVAAKRKYLATLGLYATMRHPQHLGIIIWTLGFAFWGAYYLDFIFWFTLVYVLILLAWHEERKLKEVFGINYHVYQQNTPFMIPIMPKKGVLPQISSGRDVAVLAGVYIIGIVVIFCVFYFFSIPWW